ncbi:o-succinylbenzoate synthase [Tessaracoccus sp. MC1865]|uniref:o-succinylbenzoate synthase n=1 Tax=unclassified Tessaracoccus TaxID=2635419 RepID=UPI001602C46A|nr:MULTISPECIES: o-succinylbenzoate synthase [unclassified Tessaracoccus]MBB1483846.1 o-succinylbenzoate synthase [Tessaracoccus sp. MC1865]MBB1508644.1 o-succinylbenzoate synthase [Tessaracoccus sp. MC1756]QTO36902.1 o-succinylbenzoate synthase [Tessaracoccus sp. MC1865]
MRLFVYDIPLTVRFRGISHRSGVLFEGPAGWAEWSPFPEYDDAEAAAWLRAAMEMAEEGYPAPVRDTVPVNGIVPGLPPEQAAARAVASGCSTIKIKVAASGERIDDDIARVAAVHAALPGAKLRVDANGGWSLEEAAAALRELDPFGLEYAEQPCATVEELAALRRLDLGTPIAADESIRRAGDPLRVKRAGAADIAMLKVQPLGGVRACLRLAEELAMPVVVSSAVETSVGLRAGLALAAALPELPHACGLETARLLDGDVTASPLHPVDGVLPVRPVVVDPALLERYAAGPELTRFWLDRWRRVS